MPKIVFIIELYQMVEEGKFGIAIIRNFDIILTSIYLFVFPVYSIHLAV